VNFEGDAPMLFQQVSWPVLSMSEQVYKVKILIALLTLRLAGVAGGQTVLRPDVPNMIQAPAGESVILRAHASGSQIYVCRVIDSKPSWTLKAPEAELHDDAGAVIGSHYAGPTWKHKDGSEVTGKAAARVDAIDPGSIPWLLVKVVSHSGNGLLASVTSIQRVHTHGGQAPAEGCDESHKGAETKSSYTADYYFYAPAK